VAEPRAKKSALPREEGSPAVDGQAWTIFDNTPWDRPMNVNLTPELEKLIHGKVRSGHDNNQSEVVREALRLMAARDRAQEAHIARLKEVLAEGIAQADRGELVDLEVVDARIRTALRRKKRSGKKAG
jgi:antitoxin ParD1/3/4